MEATKAVTAGLEDAVRAVSRIRHADSCRNVKTLSLCLPNNGRNCCLSVSFFFHQWRNTQFYVASMWRIFWSQSRMDKGNHIATVEEKQQNIFIQGKRSWGMYNERNLRDDRYKRQILVYNDHKEEGRDGVENPCVTQWQCVEMEATR